MSFMYRGKEITLPYYALTIENGSMVYNGSRYPFFERPTIGKDQDLCHSYSAASIAKYLCACFNTNSDILLYVLICALYPHSNAICNICNIPCVNRALCNLNDFVDVLKINAQNDITIDTHFFDMNIKNYIGKQSFYDIYLQEFEAAMELINSFNDNPFNRFHIYNELFYIFNSALSNLRPGNKHWNRSLGEAYDPAQYSFNSNLGFVITDLFDIYRLAILMSVIEFADDPTYYFFTAADIINKRFFIYSSSDTNEFQNVNNYVPNTIQISLKNKQGLLVQIANS